MAKGELDRPRRHGDQEREVLGWLREFLSQFDLAWKLLWDGRVPLTTKLVPLLMLLYLVMPIDLIPDTLVGPGQVDDLVLILVGLRMFISLAPPAVVAEYRGEVTEEGETEVWPVAQEDVVDLEAKTPGQGELPAAGNVSGANALPSGEKARARQEPVDH